VVLLAVSFGIFAGYLDLGILFLGKLWWHSEGHFRCARDAAWTVPMGHAVLLAAAGAVVVAMSRARRHGVSLRAASWLFATLAIWCALLRMPLYGWTSLALAAGLGRPISRQIVARGRDPRCVRWIAIALAGALGVLAGLTTGRQAISEHLAIAGLPAAPSTRNVVLIVWDTVRAYNTNLGAYTRNTTPKLARWAQSGVRYDRAIAPAPWTYPSHACFLTGQWPLWLDAQWKFTLDGRDPTLAEFLSGRGYQTAGFAANTNCCTYESGLARGFAHYEDYDLSPKALLTRTVPGKWLLEHALGSFDFNMRKWISLESRGARAISEAFLGWLDGRRLDRPFFAFLNYFDAHEPYLPPREYEGRFGLRPRSMRDYDHLYHFVGTFKDPTNLRDIVMARDFYDDCIAYLDDELENLLSALKRRRLLDDTVVIITSDHGEAFGEHGTVGHAYSVYLDEIFVPLVILAPGAPAGRIIHSPASLRDLPATVVDLLGLAGGSPFPGHSLADCWSAGGGSLATAAERSSPALAERAEESLFQSHELKGAGRPGLKLSLVASGHHYIRDGAGNEKLFDLRTDRFEQVDLVSSADHKHEARAFREMLLDVLTQNQGSAAVERAYLGQFRQSLQSLVESDRSPQKGEKSDNARTANRG
jgi:arylsulfatase A-like enzyme